MGLLLLMAIACGGEGLESVAVPGASEAEEARSASHSFLTPLAYDADLPMSVAEAYAAIPHRRTEFDFAQSRIDPLEARYLRASFHLIEQGTRARVTAHRDLYYHGVSEHGGVAKMGEVLEEFGKLDPPEALEPYHRLILQALQDQEQVLIEWRQEQMDFAHRDQIGRHAKVRRASSALKRAYGLLLDQYGGGQTAENREALFDYHCALDFL